MTGEDSWTDPVKRLIEDHEAVSEYAEMLAGAEEVIHDRDAWRRLSPLQDFFRHNIVEHFEYEENTVFKTLLSGAVAPGCVELIHRLQQEHEELGAALKRVMEMMPGDAAGGMGRKTELRLYGAARKLIDELLEHASLEDKELLPLIRSNLALFGRGK